MLNWPTTAVAVLFLLISSKTPVSAFSFSAPPVNSAIRAPEAQPRQPSSCHRCLLPRGFASADYPLARRETGSMASDTAAAGTALPGVVGVNGGKETPLFVYGTLMNDKVLFALLGRVPATEEACLQGYHRYRIKNHVFPAIRPAAAEGESVRGLFMPGLDAREKLIFDLFEDDDYHKVDVEVKVDGVEETRTATSYVWNASAEDQLYGTWEPSTHFTEGGPVPDYVSMVERFAREIQEEGLLEIEATPTI